MIFRFYKFSLISFCLFINLNQAKAQDKQVKFGEISMEELEMNSYKGDSSVSAVVLYDYGYSAPKKYIHHKRIKILNKNGYRWATLEVPIFRRGRFITLKATTYNLERGKIIESELDSKLLYKDEFNDFLDVIKFAFPNVKEGSVIEFTYEISPEGSNIFLNDQVWEFQSSIPTVWSEFSFVQSRYATYQNLIQGYHPIALFDESKLDTWRWAMKDIPAFKDEPYPSSYKNYISKVRISISAILPTYNWPISISSSWEEVRKNYYKSFFEDDNVKFTRPFKATAEELSHGLISEDEKFIKIFNYVKNKFSWNEKESINLRTSVATIMEKNSATSGEINLILLAMLRYAQVDANPVLVSTRDNGMVRPEMSDFSQFNRVIVQTNFGGKRRLVDATDKFLSFEFLPERCINGPSLLLTKTGIEWVDTKDFLTKSRELITMDVKLTEHGDLDGKLELTKTGYEATRARRKYEEEGNSKYISIFFSPKVVDLKESLFEGVDKSEGPFKQNHLLSLNEYCSQAGDKIYFIPVVHSRIDQNPFKAADRMYPIDFIYSKELFYSATVKIPENYEIDELPKPKLAMLPNNDCKFMFNVTGNGQVITISSQVLISRSLFSQLEYESLREFYNVIIAKQAEQIVLRKKIK